MKQIALSIDQMQKLELLGLDTSDASMYYDHIDGLMLRSNGYPKYEDDIPAYTLQDVLEKLPTSLIVHAKLEPYEREFLLSICKTVKAKDDLTQVWQIGYFFFPYGKEFINESLLDAAYEILIWCIENNYIKTNNV